MNPKTPTARPRKLQIGFCTPVRQIKIIINTGAVTFCYYNYKNTVIIFNQQYQWLTKYINFYLLKTLLHQRKHILLQLTFA